MQLIGEGARGGHSMPLLALRASRRALYEHGYLAGKLDEVALSVAVDEHAFALEISGDAL